MMEKLLSKVFVSKLEDLPEKLGKTVIIGELELAVFKLEDGKVRAIENRCPHKGGVLAEGMVSGEHVFCPMHDWKISTRSGKVQEPDTGCVQTYETEVKKNEVYVIVPGK
ncbi:nitrite reductase small subunit NirD [Thalassobacillus devorans]|uniref:nitrite reductase small subunit NirD n=1 Tax=Thalassobacillus devorans TaxID=279813 RepID=UPI000A1CEEB9|nr:nitrite reductase small subunit NirD [Thalassobacillus devorans]